MSLFFTYHSTITYSRSVKNTKMIHPHIQMSSAETQLTLGVFCLTEPNIAERVRRVVMAMATLPGIASGGRKRDSQATMTNRPKAQAYNNSWWVLLSPDGRYVWSRWQLIFLLSTMVIITPGYSPRSMKFGYLVSLSFGKAGATCLPNEIKVLQFLINFFKF